MVTDVKLDGELQRSGDSKRSRRPVEPPGAPLGAHLRPATGRNDELQTTSAAAIKAMVVSDGRGW